MEVINKEAVINNNLEDVLHQSMMPYAEYVILDRALPRVEDGLKPVQRRIIYSMYEQGMFPDKGYKKSARVVGDCLAKYHPHGDTSVYDAMVRLAQPYNMRMCLVDGQGNFGSIDGDPPAAMRYTEVKMQALALELVKDIEKDTVHWSPNFDDSQKEPDTVPSRFPNLLVNGATGIAVGLATNIPTHNLGEVIDGAVAYIRNPKIKIDELMKIIPGPDFPTGGYIISNGEIKKAYETGKGKILIRAKLHVETEGEKKNIVITEIPYGVNKAKLLSKIDALCEEKKDVFAGIASINDESDRNGMRAVIKLKKDASVKKILDNLYKYSDLQVSFGINTVVIAEGKPQQLGLIDILRHYTEYQRNIIVRRTKYDLDKAKERAHILEGLIIAVTNIDEVIKIIKNSPDTPTARQNLRTRFELSEKQANAILDLRLARITKLEVKNLKEELAALKELIKEYESILDSKKKQLHVVETEMLQIKKKFKDDRRSRIVETAEEIDLVKEEEKKTTETYVVGVNVKGRVRKLSLGQYKRIIDDEEPIERDVFVSTVKITSDKLVYAFTNKGNCYKMDVELLPDSKGSLMEGVKFADLFKNAEKGEVPVTLFAVKGIEVPQGKLIFFTRQGMIKLTDWQEYTVQKSVYQAIKLKDGDELMSVEEYKKDEDLFFVTKFGMCLKAENEVPEQGRVAGGVKGIALDGKDEVVLATFVNDNSVAMLASTFGTFKKVKLGAIATIGRARKGVKIFELGDAKFGEMVLACTILDGTVVKIKINDRFGTEYYSTDANVETDQRTTKGKYLKNVGNCQPLTVLFSKGAKRQ
ncbi:MAG: DNA topoisomerase 4 subunit A [Clostridia bacterium]|nr:DNA topoisomerase 4 subunit A [Clostridia bacterium]